ncbi:multiple sugar transport system permease protein [Diaminobutyricimonas aerilata]|uniref:Multiple sugar transport system permease protein n=1 Tax=Diaminobutyricimonas aerilata TaxID=1162967 RepID=A0A2M9CGR1_9MICO|nr:sugar ABC transporter permease [Diaminobutyricimonas aerilata]PJJ71050.1 multiple sugar transport system permease protein [Diaminobutyricimonas aerilata]
MTSIVDAPAAVQTAVRPPAPRRRRVQKTWPLVLLLLGPSAVLIVLFIVLPAVYGIWLSLTNTQLTGFAARNPQFIGIDNYTYLLASADFLNSLGQTGTFLLFSAIIGQTVCGMIAAVLLSRPWIRGKGFFGAALLMPMVVPEVVASLTWASVLATSPEGTLNRLTGVFGGEPTAWLQTAPMLAIILVNIWRGLAFAMIMFQAALEDVPAELIEAARVDGASAVQVFRHVTLPLIRGPVFLYLLLTTISTVGVFGLVYFLTRGGPGGQTRIAAIYIYERALQFSQIGIGSAASIILLVIVIVLGVVYVRLAKVEV